MTVSRRTFVATGALALGAVPYFANAEKFSVDGRYETLPTPQPTSNPDKVEVVEVFWYGCPHCNQFQPYIDPWQESQPDYVEFVRMPAIFRKNWEAHARAYYASLAMGTLDKTHAAIFGAIHGQKRPLESKASLEEIFTQQGVDAAEFRKHYDSFGIDSGVRRAKVMQERYGIRGVPTVIVNGKYRISGSLAGSYPNMIKVMDALVDKEHNSMLSKA